MRQHLICPECNHRLTLHRPVVDASRVKCRNCKAKFYAGKATAEAAGVEEAAFGASAPVESDEPTAPVVEAAVATAPRRRRRKREDEPAGPRWLIPVGVAGLACLMAAGFFLKSTPAVPDEREEVSTETLQPELITATTPLKKVGGVEARLPPNRPSALAGEWELADAPGNVLELHGDGVARVRGAFADDKPIFYEARWYVTVADGNTFELQIGPKQFRAGNHQLRLKLQGEGTLQLTRYFDGSTNNVTERVLKRKA
jgi:hypothetical protein